MDVLELLASPDTVRIERFWNERLKLPLGVQIEVTSCLPPL
jgi:hypothetical protein